MKKKTKREIELGAVISLLVVAAAFVLIIRAIYRAFDVEWEASF